MQCNHNNDIWKDYNLAQNKSSMLILSHMAINYQSRRIKGLKILIFIIIYLFLLRSKLKMT